MDRDLFPFANTFRFRANFCPAMNDIGQSTSTARGGSSEKFDGGARHGNTPPPSIDLKLDLSHSPPYPFFREATFIRSSEEHPPSIHTKNYSV
ncbi:hypothetical protein TNCV_3244171 [Trichonephila clavipes]|nr:hypothetical protein TNCV_3244171 [Trichonephila clavipes]